MVLPDSEAAPVEGESAATEDVEPPTKESLFLQIRAEEQTIREELAAVVADDNCDVVHQALDGLLTRVQTLQATFTRWTHLLPAYDVQKYRDTVKALTAAIAEKREALAPRRRFQFKRRAAPASTGPASPEAAPTPSAASNASPSEAPGTSIWDASNGELFEGLKSQAIFRAAGELAGRDVALKGLEDCQVLLLDRIGALHCHGLRRCEILIGAVASSALLYDCQDCVITLAAKQLRLHDSVNLVFHVRTMSGPVIEHSKRIMFAPCDLQYDGVAGHLEAAGLASSSIAEGGAWTDVQDFNWLRRQASPNWCIVPSERRRPVKRLDREASAAPPALPELEMYKSCWQAAEATVAPQQGDQREAPPKQASEPPKVDDGHDDEF